MKTFTAIALAAAVLASIPAASIAAPAKMTSHKMAGHKMAGHKMAAATKYECVKCHMQYSAAEAKKDHYKCDMDGGKLVAVKPGAKKTM
jgi:hypothetical protein